MAGRREDKTVIPFINLVKAHECLWNCTIAEYSKADVTSSAWREIAAKIKDTEKNCKERWKNIRTAYVRSLKPPKSGDGPSSKKNYYLAEQLSFLRPYLKRGETSGNLHVEDSGEENPHSIKSNEGNETFIEEEISDDLVTIIEKPSHTLNNDSQSIKKRKGRDQVDNAFIEFLKFKNTEKCQIREQDAEQQFLLSLLPEVKSLSLPRRRIFKIQILSLLNKLLEEDEQEGEDSRRSRSSYTVDMPDHSAVIEEVQDTVPSTSVLNGSVIFIKQEKHEEESTCPDDSDEESCEEEQQIINGPEVVVKEEIVEGNPGSNHSETPQIKEEEEMIITIDGEMPQIKEEEEIITIDGETPQIKEEEEMIITIDGETPQIKEEEEMIITIDDQKTDGLGSNSARFIGTERHQCPQCEYKSVHNGNLKTHIMIHHTGEKPHRCPHCDYRSAHNGNLKTHIMARHTGAKPYRCPCCEFKGVSFGALKKHIMAHHNWRQALSVTPLQL